jgi:hypothetical protein
VLSGTCSVVRVRCALCAVHRSATIRCVWYFRWRSSAWGGSDGVGG